MKIYILWIVIAAYSFFILLKRKKNTEKKTQTAATLKEYEEAAIITAAIAAAMGSEKEFETKNFYLVGETDSYISSWKIAGKIEAIMRKKAFSR